MIDDKSTTKSEEVLDVLQMMYEVCMKKDADYGSSTTNTYNKYGIKAYLIRLSDKMSRLEHLCNGNEAPKCEESVYDTLLDMANYCVLALADLKHTDNNIPV